jgi:hypothetical protein
VWPLCKGGREVLGVSRTAWEGLLNIILWGRSYLCVEFFFLPSYTKAESFMSERLSPWISHSPELELLRKLNIIMIEFWWWWKAAARLPFFTSSEYYKWTSTLFWDRDDLQLLYIHLVFICSLYAINSLVLFDYCICKYLTFLLQFTQVEILARSSPAV